MRFTSEYLDCSRTDGRYKSVPYWRNAAHCDCNLLPSDSFAAEVAAGVKALYGIIVTRMKDRGLVEEDIDPAAKLATGMTGSDH